MDTFTTAQGSLNMLHSIQDKLAAAQKLTEVVSAVQRALSQIGDDYHNHINNALSKQSVIEEIQKTVIDEFAKYLAIQEQTVKHEAEKERQRALAQLAILATQLQDPNLIPDSQLLEYLQKISECIERTVDDEDILSRFSVNNPSTESREALLDLINAHIQSGVAGKFWL